MPQNERKRSRRNGLLALSPLLVMAVVMIAMSVLLGGFSKTPLVIVFLATSAYALLITRGHDLSERITLFSRGAGNPNLLLMIWIFLLAGAFASSAKAVGAISATVDMTLTFLPSEMLLVGVFIAACFISISIGTSVGTIAALVPVAVGIADRTGISLSLVTAACVGGAFFGDNLSFISDTTIVATRTQGCKMKDKFRANFMLVLPAALLTIILYFFLGQGHNYELQISSLKFMLVLPYVTVIVAALLGMNVLLVLALGNVLTGVVGGLTHSLTLADWISSMADGCAGMSELILISMMAGGLLELIRVGGGITFIIRRLTRLVHSKTGAELSIGTLVALTNFCTANNTVAILSVGTISADIANRFGVDPRKSASILDTFSCVVQSIIPYGAQLLIASGLAGINPLEIIPHLYYPFILALVVVLGILLRFPRQYS